MPERHIGRVAGTAACAGSRVNGHHGAVTADVDPEFERASIRARLDVVVSLDRALDNMDEINLLVRASSDRTAAVHALQERFGFAEQAAHNILDLTIARQTHAGRLALRAEIEAAREMLARLD